jgi:ATPase subunit of ABC transporter with duplicated ATPase domains
MMTGEQQPDTGTVTLGDSVKVAYVGQIRDTWITTKPFGKKFLVVWIS